MQTLTCQCGLVIPYRNVLEHYRLTPNAEAIRAREHLGSMSSLLQRFMDKAERETRQGQTVLRLPVPAATGSPNYARLRDILRRCQNVGYLEYVCPRCEEALTFPIARTLRTRWDKGSTASPSS